MDDLHFFVLVFFVPLLSFSSAWRKFSTRIQGLHKIGLTFRLVDLVFESSLPPLALGFDVEAVLSFGLTAKKPSIRPCCFELTALVSFSHDLRTRSSLGAMICQVVNNGEDSGNAHESLLPDKKIDQSLDIWLLPLELKHTSELCRSI